MKKYLQDFFREGQKVADESCIIVTGKGMQ